MKSIPLFIKISNNLHSKWTHPWPCYRACSEPALASLGGRWQSASRKRPFFRAAGPASTPWTTVTAASGSRKTLCHRRSFVSSLERLPRRCSSLDSDPTFVDYHPWRVLGSTSRNHFRSFLIGIKTNLKTTVLEIRDSVLLQIHGILNEFQQRKKVVKNCVASSRLSAHAA